MCKEKTTMKAMTSTLALSVFALFASSVSLSAHAQDSNQPPPMLVQIDEAREQAISQLTWVPGTVLSVIDANLASEVDGRISKLGVCSRSMKLYFLWFLSREIASYCGNGFLLILVCGDAAGDELSSAARKRKIASPESFAT